MYIHKYVCMYQALCRMMAFSYSVTDKSNSNSIEKNSSFVNLLKLNTYYTRRRKYQQICSYHLILSMHVRNPPSVETADYASEC